MKTNIKPRSTTIDPALGAGTGTPALGDRQGEKSAFGDGDPIRYTPEFAILVCERIASSPRSLFSVCSDPDMPSRATLFRWLRDHPDFREIYREAKEAQADILIEEGLDIIDDDSNDVITTADGRTIINMAAVHRSKAQVDYRKWIASKFLPRKYGNADSNRSRGSNSSPDSFHSRMRDPERAGGPEPVERVLTEEMRMLMIEERRRQWEAAEAKQEQAATKAAADAARAAALAQTGIEDSSPSPDALPPRSHPPSPNYEFRTAISDRPSPKKARQEYDLSPIPERPARHEQCPAFHSGRYI
jgi:hypothetical protein